VLLVVDAMEPDKVREMMENEVASMMARHEEEASIYDKLGSYAPAFGMIGTLVGLINMLASMDMSSGSAGSLGSSMATAMITTFYGCILANLICAPIAKKLRIRTEEEVLYKQIIIEGVIGIQSGENPKNIKEKLVSLLHQKRQQKLLTDGGGDKKGKK
jgi:chemotaxis protein MotA